MIREIFSMPWADTDYLHNFEISSDVFTDDESETEAKTNNGHRVCLLLACTEHTLSLLFACKECAQSLLFACHVHARTPQCVISPPRADLNSLTHSTGKGGPSIFKWSALSVWSADWNVWSFDREQTFIHV